MKVYWGRLIVHTLIHKGVTHTKISQWRHGNTKEYSIQMKVKKRTKELIIKSRWQKKDDRPVLVGYKMVQPFWRMVFIQLK